MVTGGVYQDDNQIDIREVEALVEQKDAEAIKRNWYDNKNIDRIADATPANNMVLFESVPLLNDLAMETKYAVLPTKVIELPNGGGLVSVRPTGISRGYSIVNYASINSYINSNGARVSGQMIASQIQDKVYIFRPVNSSVGFPATVSITVVAANADYVSVVNEGYIINEVLKVFGVRRRPDLTIDGVKE
jgi:hypothetical protein